MRNSILFLKCTFNCALEKFTQVTHLKFAGKLDQNKNKNINKISPKNLQNIGTKMQILVKDPKNGEELNMIEMQGDLESRLGANVDVSGKFIGDLHYTKDGGIPILIIGVSSISNIITSRYLDNYNKKTKDRFYFSIC